MATFKNDTEKWYDTVTITKQTGGFTIPTKNRYMDRHIELNYNIPGMVLPKPSSGTTNFYITVPNGTNETVTFHFTVDSNGNTTIT